MKHFIFLFFLPVIMTLSSCESMVTDIPASKLPQTESRLVVQSFISPQADRINVAVSESIPLFGESRATESVLKDAIVKISNGEKEIVIPYDLYRNLHSVESAEFPIAASKTYTLTVIDRNRTVTAKCTVPAKAPDITTFTLDTLELNPQNVGPDQAVNLRMSWRDIAADTNFYRVKASMLIDYGTPVYDDKKIVSEKRLSATFNFQWDQGSGREEFQSDRTREGSLLTSPSGKVILPNVIVDGYNFFQTKRKIKWVEMEIFNTDVHYYKYHRSIEVRGDSDNPFSEPTIIYSNIEGGLGCFGAYNSGKLVYRN
ncbi:MAG: DUF4249 domain-containing protein [Dyadobacter sp.]|uniref:DUF4249 domain-containing protein n=1 Tax=Dyadobacter sp. TaxID=1914288 RepID=UPI003262F8D8